MLRVFRIDPCDCVKAFPAGVNQERNRKVHFFEECVLFFNAVLIGFNQTILPSGHVGIVFTLAVKRIEPHISPGKFIPLAEESRLVIPLGDWGLDTALSTIRTWENDYNFDGIVSVNVSPIQFKKDNFIDELIKKINRHGIDVRHLEIEITEGMLIDSIDETVAKLSIVGAGMQSNAGVAAKMFEALYGVGVNIRMIATSEIRITVLIDIENVEVAMKAVHAAFLED